MGHKPTFMEVLLTTSLEDRTDPDFISLTFKYVLVQEILHAFLNISIIMSGTGLFSTDKLLMEETIFHVWLILFSP